MSTIQQSAYSAALGAIHKSHEQALGAVKKISGGDLDALPETYLDLMTANHAQMANLKVIDTLQESEGYLLDIFA